MFKKILFLIFIIIPSLNYAQSVPVREGHVQVQLISEVESIEAGHSFWVAVRLIMDPGWHTYWQNPGDSGLPTKIQWDLPKNFKAGPVQWPYPQKIEEPPLTSYGYEGQVLLMTKMDVPKDLAEVSQSLKARVSWLVCKEGCIPGHASLELPLPASHGPSSINMLWSKIFSEARSKLPLQQSNWNIRASTKNHSLIIDLLHSSASAYSLSGVYFFPLRDDLINHADSQILKPIKDGYELTVSRSSISSKPLTGLKGILLAQEGWRGPGTERALTVDVSLTPAAKEPSPPSIRVWAAFIFAFLGGLILNLMPCVLPVLSLKILGFLNQAHQDKTKMWSHGLIFTSGVLVSFWLLAGLLILLRSAGQHIGWGFQFQSPWFLVFLIVLFLIFALNLFGIFEILLPFQIRLPQEAGWLGVFLNGVLATITATPCTAPFMGTALGFALAQPPLTAFGIFTCLALGMSFPYLLLSLFPSLLGFLPKPGPWMIHFKKFLGLLLAATVVWLSWVLGTETGFIKQTPWQILRSSEVSWKDFSPAKVKELRAQHEIVFIDFTAKWCLTCQVNERIALDNPAVIKKFKQLHVAALKADWTLQDSAIAQALAEFGKNSIPLYVIYGKDPAKGPFILPEIITPKTVLDALDQANL